jgi:serine/threonine-protein kinase HipA
MNPVELLCFIGARGMGALEFEPVLPKANNAATKIELSSLIQIAQQILTGRQQFNANLSADEAKALSDILKIGTSAGGARAKAVIAFNPDTKEIRSGQADAPKGFTHWLLKFDGVTDQQLGTSSGYGRVEMAYYLMAKEAAIEMTEIDRADSLYIMTTPDTSADGQILDVNEVVDRLDGNYDSNYSCSYWPCLQIVDKENTAILANNLNLLKTWAERVKTETIPCYERQVKNDK